MYEHMEYLRLQDEAEAMRALLRRCVPALEMANGLARFAKIDPATGVELLAEVKLSCLPLVGAVEIDKAAG